VPLTQIIALSLVQGITEFLPISSSGHLVLVPIITGWQDQGLVLDIAVHIGTLVAIVVYFWRDLFKMVIGVYWLLRGRNGGASRLAAQLTIATVPLIIVGYFFGSHLNGIFRSMEAVGWASLVFGLLLYFSDRMSMTVKKISHLLYSEAILIGLSQVLALIPGTSRSGITITAARFLGFERQEAARFSMLLSIPAIVASGVWLFISIKDPVAVVFTQTFILAIVISFLSALFTIVIFMAWLQRSNFTPFVVYRVVLGVILIVLANY
jgi:undecaprenyl-diphosphatase